MPVDFSESSLNAFTYANQMVQALHGQLILLHVVEPIGGDAIMFVEDSVTEQEAQEARTRLTDIRSKELKEVNDPFVDIMVETGFVVDKILKIANEQQISLIVMGTQGSGGRLEDIFGSNTYKVVKEANCAVLTVPLESSRFDIKKIALAVKLQEKENIHLLTVLKHLARHFHAEIILLHVAKENEISLEEDIDSPTVLWLTEQLKGFKKSFINISSDNVADGINEYVINNNIDLLAVSPGRHNFFYQLIEGSTTRKLVLHSHVPLLTLPADY